VKQASSSWSVVKTLQTCACFKYKLEKLLYPVEKDTCNWQWKTEGNWEGPRQPSELVHGLGQRQQMFWRKERSLWCGVQLTVLCVSP